MKHDKLLRVTYALCPRWTICPFKQHLMSCPAIGISEVNSTILEVTEGALRQGPTHATNVSGKLCVLRVLLLRRFVRCQQQPSTLLQPTFIQTYLSDFFIWWFVSQKEGQQKRRRKDGKSTLSKKIVSIRPRRQQDQNKTTSHRRRWQQGNLRRYLRNYRSFQGVQVSSCFHHCLFQLYLHTLYISVFFHPCHPWF